MIFDLFTIFARAFSFGKIETDLWLIFRLDFQYYRLIVSNS